MVWRGVDFLSSVLTTRGWLPFVALAACLYGCGSSHSRPLTEKQIRTKFELARADGSSIWLEHGVDWGLEEAANETTGHVFVNSFKKSDDLRNLLMTLLPARAVAEDAVKKMSVCRVIWQGGMDPAVLYIYKDANGNGWFRFYDVDYAIEDLSKFESALRELLN